MKISAVAFVAAFGLAAVAAADDPAGKLPPPASKQGLTYAADIKPVLDSSCVKCHSGDKPKGRLRLDTLENALKGGKDGKVIVPGDSAKSMLVLAAGHATSDPDMWMPPKKFEGKFPPLKPEQISVVRAWIDQGAK